ncbi:hypothetical protein [Paraburkholderia bannensis]|uniref:hypothetical protein n=1 Tax=Paraburkholderia bannensis TaxID=765414 RepID=UPI002AC3135A|nr:hypothetical protein [Paraburkholderia bannensis]
MKTESINESECAVNGGVNRVFVVSQPASSLRSLRGRDSLHRNKLNDRQVNGVTESSTSSSIVARDGFNFMTNSNRSLIRWPIQARNP